MRDLRKLGRQAARAGLTAASLIPAGPVGAAAIGAALFKKGGAASPLTPEDVPWAQKLAADFDYVPIMDAEEAKARCPKHDSSNLHFIQAPGPAAGNHADQAFFRELERRHWQDARPTAGVRQTGHIGGQRPMMLGPNNQLVPMPGTRPERALHGKAARDWGEMAALRRVNAYTFRGDQRSPDLLKPVGGFRPPSTRTDDKYVKLIADRFVAYMQRRHGRTVDPADAVRFIKGQGQRGRDWVEYEIWRAILQSEEMHIGRMAGDEFLRGYISTTRDPGTALGFATRGDAKGVVWIYAVHTQGGFLLPTKAQSPGFAHVGQDNEAEIAHPGVLPFDKIIAARSYTIVNFDDPTTFNKRPGVIFFKRGFYQQNRTVGDIILASLSALA